MMPKAPGLLTLVMRRQWETAAGLCDPVCSSPGMPTTPRCWDLARRGVLEEMCHSWLLTNPAPLIT